MADRRFRAMQIRELLRKALRQEWHILIHKACRFVIISRRRPCRLGFQHS
jgi:hypothetical protein